ncbi:MAG: TonB-dependent receptor [Desulfobacteraceae bacterium]|nr:TonB-dependent receptor [Desulfobacteraceae bacterium]
MRLRRLIFGIMILTFLSPFVYAETEVLKDDPLVMDEVVVTSTRTKHTVMETPSNISVITAKDIKAMDAKNMAEIIKKMPGVYATNASGLEPKLSLRGTHIGMSPGAMVLINGIPMSLGKFGYTDYESIPVETIERIEIVKGPMSSLYGGNSARGVINVITKKSLDNFGGNIKLTAGSHRDRRVSASIHGAKGDFDYTINAKKKDTQGYRDDTWLDNTYFNGDFGFWLSDNTRLGAYINITDKERALAKKLSQAQKDKDRRQSTDYSLTENLDMISGISLEVKKEIYDITSNFYYKTRDKTYKNYLRATSTPYKEELDENVYGMRNIFTFKKPILSKANKLSMGFDYDYDDIDILTMKAAAKDPSLPYTKKDPKKTGDFNSSKIGIFLQDEFTLLDNLTFTIGLRYDYFEFESNAEYDFSKGGTLNYNNSPDYDRLSPRFAVNYQYSNDMSIYGSYSQSYRAPSIYDYYASGAYSAKNNYILEPETFTQYELGVRYRLAQWLNIDAAVYQLVIEDMLDSAYDSTGNYMGKQNINETTMKGFELGLSGHPIERVTYSIAYTYTDAIYSGDFFTRTGDNIKGNRVTKIPHHRLNIDVGIQLIKVDAGELVWNINYITQNRFAMDNVNSSFYKGYGLLNSLLRWKNDKYEIFLGLDNILDREYDGYAYTSSGKDYFYPAAGRTFVLGLEYKF